MYSVLISSEIYITRTKRLYNSCYNKIVSQNFFATMKINTCYTGVFRAWMSEIFCYNGTVSKTGRTKMAIYVYS